MFLSDPVLERMTNFDLEFIGIAKGNVYGVVENEDVVGTPTCHWLAWSCGKSFTAVENKCLQVVSLER